MQNARVLLSSIVDESELSRLLDAPSMQNGGALADNVCSLAKTNGSESESKWRLSETSRLALRDESKELLGTTLDLEGRFLVDAHGKCEYQGQLSGLGLARWIGEQCSRLLEIDRCLTVPIRSLTGPSHPPRMPLRERSFVLPSRTRATWLTNLAFDHAFILTSFIHRPTFENGVDDLSARQARKESPWEPASLTHLSLLESVLAVGCMFESHDASHIPDPDDEDVLSEA